MWNILTHNHRASGIAKRVLTVLPSDAGGVSAPTSFLGVALAYLGYCVFL